MTDDIEPCPDDSSIYICTHEDGEGHVGLHVAHDTAGRILKEWS